MIPWFPKISTTNHYDMYQQCTCTRLGSIVISPQVGKVREKHAYGTKAVPTESDLILIPAMTALYHFFKLVPLFASMLSGGAI